MNGNVSELERAAMDNKPMPEGLRLYEQIYFQALSCIYLKYRAGRISREQGSKEKNQLKYNCERLRSSCEEYLNWCKYYQALYTKIAQASAKYARERTIDSADKLYELIYGCLPPSETNNGNC